MGEGLVEITNDRVAILTNLAVAAKDIDEAKAEEARERAEARLREQVSADEVAAVNAALALAGTTARQSRPAPLIEASASG